MSNYDGPRKRISVADLAAQASGRWLEIIPALCPGMFDEAIENLGRHVRCPLHGGEDDFRFVKRSSRGTTAQTGVAMCTCGPYPDGFSLLQRAMGKSFREVLEEVDTYLNGHLQVATKRSAFMLKPKQSIQDSSEEKANARIRERIHALWNVGKPLAESHTTYYLKRGISAKTLEGVQDLRFLHQLGYYETTKAGQGSEPYQKIGSFPALLGLMRDVNGQPVAIHRTWLSEDQTSKAPVAAPKKLTQTVSASGATIRLFQEDNEEILGLCEGIETALAVRELIASGQWADLSKMPVWACFSAGNLQGFQLPEETAKKLKCLVIFSDNDENGTGDKAAQMLKKRFAIEHPKVKVIIRQPDVMGWDWLDFLVNQKLA